jgi:uncharacterized protein (TIGR03083 family)
LFRPVSTELVALLNTLPSDGWQRPTIAGSWAVRDVLAHLVDLTFRRLSFHRDRMAPPPPPRPIASERDFVDFINGSNGLWIDASRRFSPRVLTDLFALGSRDLADWFEALPLEAPALFGVSWAGEQTSEGWFDVGREFVELWHHQEQIRMAVGAPSLADPRYLGAVLAIAVRGVAHAYRERDARPGDSVVIEVTGKAGGTWTLLREGTSWHLHGGEPATATTRVRLQEAWAWKLFCHAVKDDAAAGEVQIDGDRSLGEPLFRARAVIV